MVWGAEDKDMKDISFLQILTTIQARGRERERGFEEKDLPLFSPNLNNTA